jgi:hypothetical protein
MQLSIPSGYFVDNHAVWGDLGAGAILSRTFAVEFPDLSASDDSVLTRFESDLRLMLGCLQPDERAQLEFYTGNDFGVSIKRYAEPRTDINICRSVRHGLVLGYTERMELEQLIQSNARLSISTRMPKLVTENGKKVRGFDDVFKVLVRLFEQREQFFNLLLTSYGGSVKGLDNAGQFSELLKFWSPSQSRVGAVQAADSNESGTAEYKNKAGVADTMTDWLRPIDDLCRFSSISPRSEPDHGFYMDGYYFGVLVAKTMPRATWAKTMEPFLALTIPNLRVVLNMEPLVIDDEMRHEEERFGKLASNIDPNSPSLQSEVGLDKHRDRMRLLMSNKVVPFRAQLIVIVSDRTPDGLDARLEAVRLALGKTGCEPFEPAIATSALAFFNCTTPGIGPWVPYRDYWHKMDDAVNVANMWPAGSTPRADLEIADWITDGHLNNIIGGRNFIGAQPVHMLVAATTGAGKSTLVQSLVLQTAHQFKFIAVIDDGLSWMTTCNKLDPTCKPISVRSNGNKTFNIFDTRGQQLTNQHKASATALCHLLVGEHADQDKDKLRHAVLADTISAVYGSAFEKWRKNNPAEYYEIGLGLDDGRQSEEYVQNVAFARWSPDMFPTLFDLQDELHSASIQKGPYQELCATLASLLRPWLRDGIYGPIVDGASNIDLGSADLTDASQLKVVHFELGEMGESEAELKAVVGFLITNEVRNHIQGMSRGIKKQVIIEEMTSFLKVPNGAQIVVDYYERMRKYSCQVISIFQQYSTLLKASPKVAEALVHNSSAMILMRNHNRKDLDTLGGYLPRPIPEVIQDQITRFAKPAEFSDPEKAFAGFVYVQLDREEPQYTIGRNYISEEVEKITSSSGDVFEEKKAELNQL